MLAILWSYEQRIWNESSDNIEYIPQTPNEGMWRGDLYKSAKIHKGVSQEIQIWQIASQLKP